ncbi:trypsin-like serine protease [Kitasatospora griseola]|uniref:trypsin-like serine protease n=1 Tax=Kitasatospora griseola TaxID=2064 RepID=UPI0036614AD3
MRFRGKFVRVRYRWPIPLAAAAVVLGMPATIAPAQAADAANSAAPSAVETGAYPDAARIQQQTGVTVTAGDGHITLADCSGDYQVKVWTGLDQAQPAGSIVCFKATGASGYLALSVPEVFGIATYADRSLTAQLSAAGATSSVDVGKNQFKAVGESAPGGGAVATLLELRVTGPAATPTTTANDPATAFTAQLAIGTQGRTCTGALVDPQMILTAKSCFLYDPTNPLGVTAGPPKLATTATVGRTDLNATGGEQIKVVALAPHADHDLVMARLETPVTGIAPIALSATAPATDGALTTGGYGRTATDWIPGILHTPAAVVGTVTASGFDLTSTAAGLICAGDAGGPVWRTENGHPALAGIITRSWQGGCLGTGSTETRTGAYAERTDDLADWIVRLRAAAPGSGWKSSVLVNGANGILYRAIRLPDGSTTNFVDMTAATGTTGGVKAFTEAGLNDQTHIVALGNDGHLWHTITNPAPLWQFAGTGVRQPFDLTGPSRPLAGITQVSAVSIGANLHVVAIAGGKAYHTVLDGNGVWSGWGDVQAVAGTLPSISTAAIANVGGELQVVAIAGGKAYHTIRNAAGSWGTWGDVAQAAGATGTITGVAIAGYGNDAHIAVLVNNGTQQLHTIRFANKSWQPFANLNGVWGSLTATSISAAAVDNQVQFTVTTSDNRLLWTARKSDATWAATAWLNLQNTTGAHNQNALTGYIV